MNDGRTHYEGCSKEHMDCRIFELEAEVERLRRLTRMDLHDAKEWIEVIKKVQAQRDRLAEALRQVYELASRLEVSRIAREALAELEKEER